MDIVFFSPDNPFYFFFFSIYLSRVDLNTYIGEESTTQKLDAIL